MNRILLNVLTWTIVASAVVGALLLAHAVEPLEPGAAPITRQMAEGGPSPSAHPRLAEGNTH